MKLTAIIALVATLFVGACATKYAKPAATPVTYTNLSTFIGGGGLSISSTGECLLTISYRNGKTTSIKLNDSVCADAKSAIVNTAIADANKAAQAPAPKP